MTGSRIRSTWSAGGFTRCLARTLPPIVGAALFVAAVSSPRAALAGGVVGTGSASSCTEAALDAALSAGGSVTFNCGGAVTITLTATKIIAADTSIDGAGMVTLSGGATDATPICLPCGRLLSLNPGVALTLENLKLANSGGGALFSGGGTLTITNSTFANNFTWTNLGGAIHITDGTAMITNSTFANNRTFLLGSFSAGGAIYNAGGTVTITGSTFSGNSVLCDALFGQVFAGSGGAIANGGALIITNSTFSSNRVGQGAAARCEFSTRAGAVANGGVYYQGGPIAFQGGSVKITNSTFLDNNSFGVSISNPVCNGSVIVSNSIIAATVGGNCAGSITDGGHNLQFPSADCGATITVADPLLAPAGLTYNGGPTQTIALQPGSPAVNNGDDAVCAAGPVDGSDQRGFARPGTGHTHCSIGAAEFYFSPTPGSTPSDDVEGDGVPAPSDNCPLVYNPDQRDTDGDGVGDTCDNCPAVLNPGQCDINDNGNGDLCDNTAPVPTPLALKQVKLKATSPNRSNGTILVQGTFDASELVGAFGSLDAALEGGAMVGVTGVGLETAQRIVVPTLMCASLRGTIRCIGSAKERIQFGGTRTGNLFKVRITARNRSFQPPLTATGVQVILSIGGRDRGLDRQDQIPSCKVSQNGPLATCKK